MMTRIKIQMIMSTLVTITNLDDLPNYVQQVRWKKDISLRQLSRLSDGAYTGAWFGAYELGKHNNHAVGLCALVAMGCTFNLTIRSN